MKTKKRILLLLNLVFLVGGADLASAFYDPTVGRWLNRDPLGDIASPLSYSPDEQLIFLDSNLYQFSGNDGITRIDPLGLIWVAGGRDHTTSASTIVCDGNGGVRVKLCPAHQNMPCGLTDCVNAHELSHRDDVLAEKPDICKGKKDNTRISETYNPDLWKSEIKASNEGIKCAKAKKATANPDCQQAIADFIKGEEAYRDGFQKKLDWWRQGHSAGTR